MAVGFKAVVKEEVIHTLYILTHFSRIDIALAQKLEFVGVAKDTETKKHGDRFRTTPHVTASSPLRVIFPHVNLLPHLDVTGAAYWCGSHRYREHWF
jgi:hypothetical protein